MLPYASDFSVVCPVDVPDNHAAVKLVDAVVVPIMDNPVVVHIVIALPLIEEASVKLVELVVVAAT